MSFFIRRLKATNKGIILLHDPWTQIAAMLPVLLPCLRGSSHHFVQLAPKEPELTPPALPDLKHVEKSGG